MSADNAIAVLRTPSSSGDDGYEYRLAEYGASGEPFDRNYHTPVSVGKAFDTASMRKLVAAMGDPGFQFDDFEERGLPDFRPGQVVGDMHCPLAGQLQIVDGFVAITFHCAQDFVALFARSEVYRTLDSAMAEARRMEEESYVEYGSECVCVSATWDELLAQADVVRQRRLPCLVRGPKAPKQAIGDWGSRHDFKCLGNPGIEDKLLSWGWPADVVNATMVKVTELYWDWGTYREAENLRLARADVEVEMKRYQVSRAKGCCQNHDEVIVVQSEHGGEVHVHLGFNFGH